MSLFADLYGYWEPPAGWTRTRDELRFCELRHAQLGTLTLERRLVLDGDEILFTWVRGEAQSSASELAHAFRITGYKVTRLRVNLPAISECTWVLRQMSFWEAIFS